MFNEIEKEANEKAAADKADREKLKENLRAVEEDENGYAAKLNQQVNADEILMDEMEQKRREEEAFRMQHERILRNLQGQNMRDAKNDNNQIAEEIQRLADGVAYEPYQEHVNERQRLQAEINNAADDNERARLLAELNNVDNRVREQLAEQSKEQDKALQDKLAARRARRNKAIEQERAHK